MKKNVLALSITAALVGLTGGAHAMTGALGGASATTLEFAGQNIGHSLIVPYFTTQSNNNTLINIVNADQHNGKAVKVRFRGAANSDDIFDFQVFLSPGDVWTANVSQGADGRSKLTTSDASCTKPDKSVINATAFVTDRLDTVLTAAQKANGTREGYVEIFNMGDIPQASLASTAVAKDVVTGIAAGRSVAATNPLYTAIKHVSKVAPCASATAPGTAESAAHWTFLDTTNLQFSTATAAANTPASAGLLPPTTGLFANWTIINVVGAAAWSGEAVAIEARDVAGTQATPPTTGAAAERVNLGNVVYWPQTATLVDAAAASVNVEGFSADPLFRKLDVFTMGTNAAVTAATAQALAASYFDLPDMSTPYHTGAATPLAQAKTLTDSIATRNVKNEWLTDLTVVATTDWTFSQPTRRYSTAFDYAFTASGNVDGRRFTNINADPTFTVTAHYAPQNTVVSSTTNGNGRQICVNKGLSIKRYDREETTPGAAAIGVVISPQVPAAAAVLTFCGEANVLSINNGGILAAGTGTLKASVAVQDADVTDNAGWMTIQTPGNAGVVGLPVLGSSFVRAANGAQTFGTVHDHRGQR